MPGLSENPPMLHVRRQGSPIVISHFGCKRHELPKIEPDATLKSFCCSIYPFSRLWPGFCDIISTRIIQIVAFQQFLPTISFLDGTIKWKIWVTRQFLCTPSCAWYQVRGECGKGRSLGNMVKCTQPLQSAHRHKAATAPLYPHLNWSQGANMKFRNLEYYPTF
jgi:hypothetical protein